MWRRRGCAEACRKRGEEQKCIEMLKGEAVKHRNLWSRRIFAKGYSMNFNLNILNFKNV